MKRFFPDNAEIALVFPLDKGKLNKYDALIYRHVSNNAFSKIQKPAACDFDK